jgi:DNA-binding transcriptional MerR regulator
MTERPYLSIGEVLGLLLEEFPDVTISKIRFLESQGLIDPERTPSGYRKFYEVDVERLRFILREQREHYLPLKVIKDRLEEGDGETDPSAMPAWATPPRGIRNVELPDAGERLDLMETVVAVADPLAGGGIAAGSTSEGMVDEATDEVVDELPPAATRTHPSARSTGRTPGARPAEQAPATEPTAAASPTPAPAPLDEGGSLSREELVAATGIDAEVLRDLESFGLVAGRRQGDVMVFDARACEVAEVAARFARLGIEVRHLRAWRTSAERETGLFEQRVVPLMRQRNPQAREESVQLLRELIALGSRLHEALVAQQLSQYLDGR